MEQQKGDLAKGHRPLARSSSSHSFSWGQVFRLWEFGGNSAPASAHLSPSALLSLSPSPREGPWMQAQAHFTAWKRVGAGQVTPEDWRNAPAVPTSPALKVQVRGWTWSGEKWGIPAPPPHQHNWLGCPPIPGYRHIIYGEGAGRCSLYSTSPAASPPPIHFAGSPLGSWQACSWLQLRAHCTHLSSQSAGVAKGRLAHRHAWV